MHHLHEAKHGMHELLTESTAKVANDLNLYTCTSSISQVCRVPLLDVPFPTLPSGILTDGSPAKWRNGLGILK